MIDRKRIHEGMIVRSSDGKKVGRVSNCDKGGFVVEKGFFFVTDCTPAYEDVADVSGDRVVLSYPLDKVAYRTRVLQLGGGLSESVTFGMAGYILPAHLSLREDNTDEPRGEKSDRHLDPANGYGSIDRRGTNAPTFGDEGGGGLL